MNALKLGLGPFIGGILFSFGLGVSGMTEPANILAFLDAFGNWDPSLLFVMVGAIGVHALLHRFISNRPAPLFDTKFYLPTHQDVDRRLLIGAAIFGTGWGITGLCPGPGLASLATGNLYAISFTLTLIMGMLFGKKFVAILDSKKGVH